MKRNEAEDAPQRRNRVEAASRGAEALSADIFRHAGFRDPTLVLRWREIAGAETARLCQPVKLRESTSGAVLTLRGEPGALLFLQHESRMLCERINAWFGRTAVNRLRFVQGPIAAPSCSCARSLPPRDAPPGDPALAFRGPESVREALVKLARQRSRRPPAD